MINNPVTKPSSKSIGLLRVDIEFFLILADLKSFVDSFYLPIRCSPTVRHSHNLASEMIQQL